MTAPTRGPRLHTGLIALRTAQEFIGRYHRHNKPPTGHNTSLGVWIAGTDQLVGVAVIGRPVSRHLDLPMQNGRWQFREVTRTCTDGTRNANSALYGACKRQWQAWGNVDHLTTTLEDLGHDVLEATSAEQALRVLHRGNGVDLVITDQLMPGMTGTQLIAAIRSERSRCRGGCSARSAVRRGCEPRPASCHGLARSGNHVNYRQCGIA